jgi:hypothetical protein
MNSPFCDGKEKHDLPKLLHREMGSHSRENLVTVCDVLRELYVCAYDAGGMKQAIKKNGRGGSSQYQVVRAVVDKRN